MYGVVMPPQVSNLYTYNHREIMCDGVGRIDRTWRSFNYGVYIFHALAYTVPYVYYIYVMGGIAVIYLCRAGSRVHSLCLMLTK